MPVITNSFLDRMYEKYSIDPKVITKPMMRKAINVELEHGSRFGAQTNVINDDPELALKIALAHMIELGPGYYKALSQMEKRLRAKKSTNEVIQQLKKK